jgi:uncharacterized Zn finger protein
VARRRNEAAALVARMRKKGEVFQPVRTEGRTIARTPWGRAWCEHCESYRDYANRLPRGRTYLRNGSVIDLQIREGLVTGRVYGSELYEQVVEIRPCAPAAWKRVKTRCSGRIGSLIELLEGRVSAEVMAEMIAVDDGIMPELSQVSLDCSCPDWARLCKHLAAVLYGVGARLDEQPELLFTLRGVDPAELVDARGLAARVAAGGDGSRRLDADLASVFGIELDEGVDAAPPRRERRTKAKPDAAGGPAPPARTTSKASAGGGDRPARTTTTGARRDAPKSAATTRARGTAGPATVTRRELLEAAVPAGTISSWLRDGLLVPTLERGTYRHTRTSRARLRERGV